MLPSDPFCIYMPRLVPLMTLRLRPPLFRHADLAHSTHAGVVAHIRVFCSVSGRWSLGCSAESELARYWQPG